MKSKPLIIGVAGGTASGKTTIANAIMDSINHPQMVMIQHDAYYKDVGHLPLAERAKINFDHPDALETDLHGPASAGAHRRPAHRNAGLRFFHPYAAGRRASSRSRPR